MVRITLMLARTPVIKFRKGGFGSKAPVGATSAPSASAPAASGAAASSSTHQLQSATTMSTSAIPDIDLPVRYRRAMLSQEEIDHINGGGIV